MVITFRIYSLEYSGLWFKIIEVVQYFDQMKVIFPSACVVNIAQVLSGHCFRLNCLALLFYFSKFLNLEGILLAAQEIKEKELTSFLVPVQHAKHYDRYNT